MERYEAISKGSESMMSKDSGSALFMSVYVKYPSI